MSRLYLIACTKLKAAERCRALDLYMASDWFTKARAYVENQFQPGDTLRILSAKYGLVRPWEEIDPYDTTLVGKSGDELRDWAGGVLSNLISQGHTPRGQGFVFLAGQHYRRHLVDWLEKSGGDYTVEVPMEGLGLGQQKAWLQTNTVPR